MKNRILLAVFLPIVMLTGCAMAAGEEGEDYQIYYLDKNKNHIAPLPYEMDLQVKEQEQVVEQLLERMAASIEEVDYGPVIRRFSIMDYQISGEQLTLNLSPEYRNLDPIEEVLTRAALVKTLTQVEGISYVLLTINGESFQDNSGMIVGTMKGDFFIDNTGEEMKHYEETELSLYFSNPAGDRLVKVNRKLVYNTNISKEKLVVEQLIKGPLTQKGDLTEEIRPTINPETQIISINVKDGICYVNLDRGFLNSLYPINTDIVLYSLVNSLAELSSVTKVQIAVEGETKITFQGKYDLSTLFEADLTLMKEGK